MRYLIFLIPLTLQAQDFPSAAAALEKAAAAFRIAPQPSSPSQTIPCDGVTDVSAWLEQSIVLPPGVCRVTRSIQLRSGTHISGNGTTILFDNPTADLFVSSSSYDVSLSDLVFTSPQRTSGHIVNGSFYRSRFTNLTLLNQYSGFKIPEYEFVWFQNILIRHSSGIGFYFGKSTPNNPGSEAYVIGTQVYGGISGYVVEDSDAVYFTNSGVGGTSSYGLHIFRTYRSPCNHFLTNFVSDTNAGTLIEGVTDIQISNSWFCGSVVGIELRNTGRVLLANSKIWLNKTHGILSTNSFGRFTGNFFSDNDVAISIRTQNFNDLTPSIANNTDGGSRSRSLVTDGRTNRIVIMGNVWVSGTQFGIPPQVNTGNGF